MRRMMERRALLKILVAPALVPVMPVRWWERFLSPIDQWKLQIRGVIIKMFMQLGWIPKSVDLDKDQIESLIKESLMEYTPKKLSCRDCGAEWASKTQLRSVRRAKEGFGGHKALCPSCSIPMTRAQTTSNKTVVVGA